MSEWLVIYFQNHFMQKSPLYILYVPFNFNAISNKTKFYFKQETWKRRSKVSSSILSPSTHPSKSYDIALHDGKHTLARPTKYEVDAFRNLGGRSRGGENRRRRKRRSGWERAWTRNESAGRNHERQGSGGEVGGTGRGEQGSHRGESTRRKELNKNGKEQGVTRCSIGIADPA